MRFWTSTLVASLASAALVGRASALDLTQPVTLDIPPQRLATALLEFSRQANIQVVVGSEVGGRTTPGVRGTQPLAQALSMLLKDSNLNYAVVGDSSISVGNSATTSRPGSVNTDSARHVDTVGSDDGLRLAKSDQGDVSGVSAAATIGTSSAGSAEAPTTLQEVIVTAQRREESVDKVPISMTALSQKTMDDLRIENLADLGSVVPGLVLTTLAPSNQDAGDIAIRGVFSNGNSPTTQLYIDETPIAIRMLPAANSRTPAPEIFDLDRVEVLRGPQGTLFGASAMGGAIRFITPQPNLEDSSGMMKADLGYTEGGGANYELGAAYGSPVIPGVLGFRVSAWFQGLSGFIDREDPFTGQILEKNANTAYNYVVRPAVTFAPTDGLTITPSLYMQQRHDQSPDSYWVNDLPNQENGSHVWGGIAQPATDTLRVGSLAVKYNFSGLSFVSDTSYLDRQYSAINDYTHAMEYGYAGTPFIPGLDSFESYENNQSFTHAWQQEFRLSGQGPSSKVNWVVGAYYRNAVQALSQLLPPDLTPLTEALFGETSLKYFGVLDYIHNGQALNFYDNFHTTDISEAGFADVTVNVTEHLKANAGVRVERVIVEKQTQVFAGPYSYIPSDYLALTLPDAKATPITPKYDLTYQFTDSDMAYVSAAKGFRPGGGNAVSNIIDNPMCTQDLKQLGITSIPTQFNSDSLWSYEVGTKDQLFERRLSIQASAFYIKWKNIQTNIGLPSCQTGYTGNRGEAVSEGFDLQIAAIVTEGLKFGALVGYDHAFYPHTLYGLPDDTGQSALLYQAGDKLLGVVPWSAAVNGEYSRDFSSIWPGSRSYLRVDYRWLDSEPAQDPKATAFTYDPETTPYQRNPYRNLNIRLGVTHGGWDLSAYVNNVTSFDPRLGLYHDYVGEPLFFAGAVRPLTFGFTSWYRF